MANKGHAPKKEPDKAPSFKHSLPEGKLKFLRQFEASEDAEEIGGLESRRQNLASSEGGHLEDAHVVVEENSYEDFVRTASAKNTVAATDSGRISNVTCSDALIDDVSSGNTQSSQTNRELDNSDDWNLLRQVEEGFTLVQSRTRRRVTFPSKEVKKTQGNSSESANRFSVLADNNVVRNTKCSDSDRSISAGILEAGSGKNKPTSSKEDDTSNLRLLNNETNFCPPIFVYGQKIDHLKKIILKAAGERNCPNVKYRFANLGGLRKKLFVNNKDLHKYLIDRFQFLKIQAFSFAPKEEKNFSILLKGLEGETDVDDIYQAILEHSPEIKISKIAPFTTVSSRKKGVPTNIFTVRMGSGQNTADVVKIKYLLHQKISWEKKLTRGYPRCFRCQRFGHNSNYCANFEVCVVCGEGHDSSKCIKANEKARIDSSAEKPTLRCANCQELGHPASYSKCPAYLKYKDKREALVKKARDARINRMQWVKETTNRYVNPEVSFADMARDNSAQEDRIGREGTDTFREFLNESKRLFNMPFGALVSKIKDFWPKYQALTDEGEKVAEYLEFVTSVVVG